MFLSCSEEFLLVFRGVLDTFLGAELPRVPGGEQSSEDPLQPWQCRVSWLSLDFLALGLAVWEGLFRGARGRCQPGGGQVKDHNKTPTAREAPSVRRSGSRKEPALTPWWLQG